MGVYVVRRQLKSSRLYSIQCQTASSRHEIKMVLDVLDVPRYFFRSLNLDITSLNNLTKCSVVYPDGCLMIIMSTISYNSGDEAKSSLKDLLISSLLSSSSFVIHLVLNPPLLELSTSSKLEVADGPVVVPSDS